MSTSYPSLGKYKIVEEIGRGGMGVVFKAEDTKLARQVAIKVLPEVFTSDPERLARFEREARAVAKMTHPNVVTVFDLGNHVDGSPAGSSTGTADFSAASSVTINVTSLLLGCIATGGGSSRSERTNSTSSTCGCAGSMCRGTRSCRSSSAVSTMGSAWKRSRAGWAARRCRDSRHSQRPAASAPARDSRGY